MSMERHQVALRVSQLDASELDHEVLSLMKSQLNNIFKYFKPGVLTKIEPELNAALRLAIWKFSVDALGSTVGQSILELKYKNVLSSDVAKPWISKRQRYLLALILIGGQWLKDRSHDIGQRFDWLKLPDKATHILDYLEKGWKVATLLNFLVFLQNGAYQFLIERLLGIRSVYPRYQSYRQVSFEFLTRELLWHGFAEFLFFILPLINFQKLKNFAMKHLIPSQMKSSASSRCNADYKECAICGDWPTIPHEIGCQHVFCYMCIKSNYLADPAYNCPVCGHSIATSDAIQPVTITATSIATS
ncbi:unnamed protein product [Owenia fusiformis]|uniref:Peroxisome biogenesis factor 2 n=1 Tax=Owenia fusiformis TaxID=6347 RepID=A0A8J1UX06_OWEFU|nr:unnamed protein product [Owenia fusiformis]